MPPAASSAMPGTTPRRISRNRRRLTCAAAGALPDAFSVGMSLMGGTPEMCISPRSAASEVVAHPVQRRKDGGDLLCIESLQRIRTDRGGDCLDGRQVG